MARFRKGQKNPKARENGKKGGRPTNVEIAAKKAELEGLAIARAVLEKELGRRAEKIARRYGKLAETDPATVRHAVDRVLPAAKQELDLTVRGKVEIFTNVQPDLGP